jgi:DNA-directed RNA polymerase subunit M/transcription elongation factor TFIIS
METPRNVFGKLPRHDCSQCGEVEDVFVTEQISDGGHVYAQYRCQRCEHGWWGVYSVCGIYKLSNAVGAGLEPLVTRVKEPWNRCPHCESGIFGRESDYAWSSDLIQEIYTCAVCGNKWQINYDFEENCQMEPAYQP